MTDDICYNGEKERREGRKNGKTVPGGKGDLSGKACLLSTFVWRGSFDKRSPHSSNFSRGVYQSYVPCSTGDWSLVYLCNVHLPLSGDDRENFLKGPVEHESRVRACHTGGGSSLAKCLR